MTSLAKHIFFSAFILIAVFSCIKEPEFAESPSIEFLSIEKEIINDVLTGGNKDSVTIGVTFQDGDGDLGLYQSEIDTTGETSNYLINALRSVNGTFEPIITDIPFNGNFTRLVTDGRVGPIEGELYYSLSFFHSFTPKRDTVKFEVQIRDRKGNISNQIVTDEIILNQF